MAKIRLSTEAKYSLAIGIGLALFPVHNKWLTDVTAINGQATIFLPVFGAVLLLLATLFYVRDNWGNIDWGSKKVLIPLIIIAVGMAISGNAGESVNDKIAPAFMGISMIGLYVASRKLGVGIFMPLAIGAGIASLGIIVSITTK